MRYLRSHRSLKNPAKAIPPGARRLGVRVLQGVLIATAAMLALAAGGSVMWLATAAVVLGLGYGAAAPASTHLLVPHTPPAVFNMVMSLRQIGVPLGGVLGSLLLPPLVVHVGWREALLAARMEERVERQVDDVDHDEQEEARADRAFPAQRPA